MTDQQINFPLMARAFPDFDQRTLPAIPTSWTESSWGNDACPSFTVPNSALLVYIDYVDNSKREIPDGQRFTVFEDEDGSFVLATDNWDEVLAATRGHANDDR